MLMRTPSKVFFFFLKNSRIDSVFQSKRGLLISSGLLCSLIFIAVEPWSPTAAEVSTLSSVHQLEFEDLELSDASEGKVLLSVLFLNFLLDSLKP